MNKQIALSKGNSRMIFPNQHRKQVWDLFLVVILLESTIYIPLKVVFFKTTSAYMWVFDCFIDLIFIVDIGVTFNTAFKDRENNELFETKRGAISKRYFKSWFLLDFITAFPYQLVQEQAGYAFKILRLIRFQSRFENV